MEIVVDCPNVKYSEDFIEAKHEYRYTKAERRDNIILATPITEHLVIRTERKVPKVGVMLVGWGGNNGSTFTAAIYANRLAMSWPTRRGTQSANWFGSLTQASTVRICDDVHVPISHLLPSVNPDDVVVGGWDISSSNIAEAIERAGVLEPSLQAQLRPLLKHFKPRPSIYDKDFIAANQESRADNIITGTKQEQVKKIMQDLEDFQRSSKVDKVIVLWTANTERFSELIEGVNDTPANLETAIKKNHSEISPSTLFAYASILKGCTYINGSPQNTFVPAILELAQKRNVFIAGDDFKSGQTKVKSVLVDFLIGAGIKPVSIVSYNHLGNNDGKNLSAPKQFRSKEISKSNVVNDMVQSNEILYKPGEKPDHVIVIKYVPYVGDSKRALDEYTSEIMMGGLNTLVMHNTCEDSLLATPIMLDLVVLGELCSRIKIKREGCPDSAYEGFHPVLSILSYMCKDPVVPPGTPVINALFSQREAIVNVLKACIGLPTDDNMSLEHRVPFLIANSVQQGKTKKIKIHNGSIVNHEIAIKNGGTD